MLMVIRVCSVWIHGFNGFVWWKYVILLFWQFVLGLILLLPGEARLHLNVNPNS